MYKYFTAPRVYQWVPHHHSEKTTHCNCVLFSLPTADSRDGCVVLGSTNLQRLALQVNPIKRHCVGCLFYRAELDKRNKQNKTFTNFFSKNSKNFREDWEQGESNSVAGHWQLGPASEFDSSDCRFLNFLFISIKCVFIAPFYRCTSMKAKFLSMLICTAKTGFPGAEVNPELTIFSLKTSIIRSSEIPKGMFPMYSRLA